MKKKASQLGLADPLFRFDLVELWSCLKDQHPSILDVVEFVHEFRTANTQIKDQSDDSENRVKNQCDSTTYNTRQSHAISRPSLFRLVHSQKTTDDCGKTKRNVRPAAASNGQRQDTLEEGDNSQGIRLTPPV